jgi:hypothetical protein
MARAQSDSAVLDYLFGVGVNWLGDLKITMKHNVIFYIKGILKNL